MAEKNCEDLDYNVEDLEPLDTKLFLLHELPSVTQSEPPVQIETLHSPKIIVEDRYEDTDGLAGRFTHQSDNHFFHSNNDKVPKVTKKSNRINNLVHFFERKYSSKNEKGKDKVKLERHSSPKTEETHPITTVENKHPEKNARNRLFNLKSIPRQDNIDRVECSDQDRDKHKRFKKCKAASDDLNLSPSVDEANETKPQTEPVHSNNLQLNKSLNELSIDGSHNQNINRKYPGSRYSKNFDALVKMKAAFISGESDDKEGALDLFKSNNQDPPLTAIKNFNTVHDQIVSDEPSEVKQTPDTVSEKENVTSKQDASEIEEVVTGIPPDERALENWETAITATMMTKKNKSRKFGKREELRGRDDRIKELLDILTKHVRSIVELQEENTNLKKDLEEMESINSKQYELIFHLSKANINHYQHRSMDSGGEQSGKSEKFRKRGSKSLDLNFKQEMPDLIAGAEKAISDY